MKLVCCLLILGISGLFVFAQDTKNKSKLVAVPSDKVLLVITNQPDSPLKIEEAKYVFGLNDNKARIIYKIHNTSKRKVSGFTLSNWHIGGGGNDFANPSMSLLPNQSIWLGGEKDSEIVPLDANLKKELKLKDAKMVSVIVLMVNEVLFTDGLPYKNNETYENFRKFSDSVNIDSSAKGND